LLALVLALIVAHESTSPMATEISYAAGKLEVLYEDEKFGSRQLAALVASKIFFYLEVQLSLPLLAGRLVDKTNPQDYTNSVRYALRAGNLFDIGTGQPGTRSEYVDTIVSKVSAGLMMSAALLTSRRQGDR
jgi:hypothetical protein